MWNKDGPKVIPSCITMPYILIITSNLSNNCDVAANIKMALELYLATQSCRSRAPVQMVIEEEFLPICSNCGLLMRKSRIQLKRCIERPSSLNLIKSLEEMMVLNSDL